MADNQRLEKQKTKLSLVMPSEAVLKVIVNLSQNTLIGFRGSVYFQEMAVNFIAEAINKIGIGIKFSSIKTQGNFFLSLPRFQIYFRIIFRSQSKSQSEFVDQEIMRQGIAP